MNILNPSWTHYVLLTLIFGLSHVAVVTLSFFALSEEEKRSAATNAGAAFPSLRAKASPVMTILGLLALTAYSIGLYKMFAAHRYHGILDILLIFVYLSSACSSFKTMIARFMAPRSTMS